MSLLQTIKDDQLTSRKEKTPLRTSILTTLIGEAAIIGKDDGNRETTDAEVVAVVKKFIKNIDETIKLKYDDSLVAEKAILAAYLPTQLTGDSLREAVTVAINMSQAEGPKDMGKVMKELKAVHDGCYDGKEASTLVKGML